MPAIALKGDNHTCPDSCGSVPHVGGSIIEGSELVKVNGVPVALVGDKCQCSCSTDTIITGSPLLTINGIQVAIDGSQTEHGGVVVAQDQSITIG